VGASSRLVVAPLVPQGPHHGQQDPHSREDNQGLSPLNESVAVDVFTGGMGDSRSERVVRIGLVVVLAAAYLWSFVMTWVVTFLSLSIVLWLAHRSLPHMSPAARATWIAAGITAVDGYITLLQRKKISQAVKSRQTGPPGPPEPGGLAGVALRLGRVL
jgi:hypothetical protein